MALTPIRNGELADAQVLMGNLTYLDDKITSTNENISSLQASIISSVNSIISSTLSTYQDINSLPSSGDVALTVNTVNKITPTGAINFQLPTITDNTKYYQIYVMLDLTTYYNVDLGVDWSFDNTLPTITQAGKYNLIYEWDGSNWVVGILKRTAVA